jgi:dienelactone hydrolase
MLPILAVLALASAPQADDPRIAFGRATLDGALEQSLGPASYQVALEPALGREAYRITFASGEARIAGGDATGAMYGCFELAERVAARGMDAWKGHVEGRPWLVDRGLNLFLTLPWDEAKNEPVYDLGALTDGERWWFHSEDYWTTLFDLMARSRLDWLDLHGAYDLWTTRFPNLYAYFVASPSFPEVGVPGEIKRKNLAQLAHVIELAHARGVRVSLMSYEARFDVPHHQEVPYESSEANLYTYTREVVAATIRALPGLDAIGFRIGESGHGGEFFRCYGEAVAESGRDIPLTTRSWITRKAKVVPLARASTDFTVEIKFNGEQWGPPYPVAGGRVPNWYSYSFEDYLTDSSSVPGAEAPRRLWPGNVAAHDAPSERWPDQPYKVVWQVRANGTLRIFPFYEPTLVRRTIGSMKLGTASGYTVEPLNAYYPSSPRYYVADPADVAFDWIHQRDAMYLMLWGRLGYDPTVSDEVFDRAARDHLGVATSELVEAWKAASRVIPTAFGAYAIGPDHRDHAPELEWGGDTAAWIQGEPFDSHAVLPLRQELALRTTGARDGRRPIARVAQELEASALRLDAGSLAALAATAGPAAREVAAACAHLGSLARYYAGRFEMARLGAEHEARGLSQNERSLAHAAALSAAAGWGSLASAAQPSFYKPFPDRLRMGTASFHWKDAYDEVYAEVRRFQESVAPARDFSSRGGRAERSAGLPELVWRDDGDGNVECSLRSSDALSATAEAWLLEKPLPSSTFFHRVPFRGDRASFARTSAGHLLAADVLLGGELVRVPLATETTPYLVVPSQPGPTPTYYSSEEALAYLAPASLDPARHGLILIGTRAWNFHRSFDVATQRKLLDAVARGMTLLVLQQDYASGRYPLDWLPAKPSIASQATPAWDPSGALGLERVETADILWQPILASSDWQVHGNGGLASARHGQGTIWLCQARLLQRMHVPAAARNLKKLLELGGRERPVVLVDAGSEGARYATSAIPDLLNAYEIPFLTLGEVIAQAQGVAAVAPTPGRAWEDRVLEGRGTSLMRAFLERKVREMAERPVPATRAEMVERQAADRSELLRALGLDPLPERTPLAARITGTLQRDGYRIEKLIYESRPGMSVTAHLYLPDPLPHGKLPVIVNPHGHWQHKKSEPVVQSRAIAQALHGYLALVVDSPGHSFEGDAPIERRELGPHDDFALLLGSSNATAIYAWDMMRALDYLATRPEADTTRVGITGESGGGLATVYAFAADERFDVAVPVVYATSMAVSPHNGCPCNHVPGTLQIGDRADVLAIRAPAPVLMIGAQDDPEFPPQGTRRTGEKLAELWRLFGAEQAVAWKVFEGPHDYNRAMRELALGFFDRHLRGVGDGTPVSEPELHPEPATSPELRCFAEAPSMPTTMRDVARARLAAGGRGSWEDLVELNGGLPRAAEPTLEIVGQDPRAAGRSLVRVESEPGLVLPGILHRPSEDRWIGVLLLSEGGKQAAESEFELQELEGAGNTCLCIDVRGTGELAGLDPRLLAYLGESAAFGMGWDAAQAARALMPLCKKGVVVVGRGPLAALAAMHAALFEPRVQVFGLEGLREWADAFDERVNPLAIQPRADQAPPLERLRMLVTASDGHRAEWTFAGDSPADLAQMIHAHLGW